MSGSLIQELKRRNVFRVALIYTVVSWVLMQIGDVMFPALLLPEWTTTMLVAFLILGFPVAMIFAWAYEITPDGVLRTEDVPKEQSITADTGQKINRLIIGVLAVAVVVLLVRNIQNDTGTISAPTVAPTGQSIAILPFKNQSVSEENAEFFADGVVFGLVFGGLICAIVPEMLYGSRLFAVTIACVSVATFVGVVAIFAAAVEGFPAQG